jgi:exonuclease SbcC
VRPYTAAPVKKGSLDALLKELDARRKEREDLHARHAELSVKCREEQAGLEERRVSVAAREKEADEGRIPIEIARKDAEALSAGRALVIGGRDPDAETGRLQGAVSSARETSERMKADAARLQTDLALLEEGLRESGLRAARSLEELAELEARLDAGLIERGFADGAGAPDRAAFLAARLEPDERKRLREAAEAIAGDRTRTASLLEADAQAREAAAAAAEQAGAGTLEEELALAAAVADTLASALADKGRNEERLRASEAAKARAAELVRERDELKARAVRSHALSQLIGSKDGKKFRNYAQGLTLGVLIGNANRQLRAMSGRYVLTEDEAEPLEFAVADGFKGGVERPAKTLSGGETFIVSLALALGLADMTGRDFDLGTLFLDEGFGTLDEDALDAAVGALSELPGTSGKLVGLITHVEALKDRFPQINVVSRQNGRSELAGPGCRRISPGTDNASA